MVEQGNYVTNFWQEDGEKKLLGTIKYWAGDKEGGTL